MKTPSKEILFLTFHLQLVQGKCIAIARQLATVARSGKLDKDKILTLNPKYLNFNNCIIFIA